MQSDDSGDRIYTQDDVDQAWRNGWGSALRMIQIADKMCDDANRRRMLTRDDKAANKAIRQLLGEWVAIIDPLLEQCLGSVRAEGRTAAGPKDGGR